MLPYDIACPSAVPSVNASKDLPERHLRTAAEYRLTGENGALAPDARVELIEGEIVDVPPLGCFHAGVVIQLTDILSRAVPGIDIGGERVPTFREPSGDRGLRESLPGDFRSVPIAELEGVRVDLGELFER